MTTFTTQHQPSAREIVLPFAAPPVHPGGSVYRSHLFGLKIEAVEADGRPVPGVETVVFLDDVDLRSIPVAGDAHIYLVTTGEVIDSDDGWALLSAAEVAEDDFDLQAYTIPRGAARIVVRYRVRDPATNELGPPLTLESFATDP